MKDEVFIELLKTFIPEMEISVFGGGVLAKFKHSDEFTIKMQNGSVIVPSPLLIRSKTLPLHLQILNA